MAESTVFRCYYDDGTITTVSANDECPLSNYDGSPLISSELTIIEDVESTIGWPWLLLVLAMVILSTKERN